MASSKFHFTAAKIQRLPIPIDGKPAYYRDESDHELHLIVRPTGKKQFYSRIWLSEEKRTQWVLIGAFPALSVEAARKKNLKNVAGAVDGIDPIRAKRSTRRELTLGDLYHELEQRVFNKLRPATQETYSQIFKNHLAQWSKRKLSSITPEEIAELRDGIRAKSGNFAANKVVRLLSTMFSHAKNPELKLYKGANPAADVQRLEEPKITRRLRSGETARLVVAISNEPSELARDVLMCLLLTGARKSNVLQMRWEQLDLDGKRWFVPSRSSKNREAMEIELSDEVVSVLRRREESAVDSEWVFPSERASGKPVNTVQKALGRVLKAAAIKERFRLHDFRHNFGSVQHDAGVDPITIKNTMGHKDFQSTLRYVHADTKRKREAVNAVSKAILGR